MPIAADTKVGMSMRFNVVIDKYDLKSWSKASGLEVGWDLVEYRAGDNDNERWICPGLTKYTNIKLERAAEPDGSKQVQAWLNSNSFASETQSASIELLDAGTNIVAKWALRNIMPVKWAIAPFDAAGNKVALETLELAHVGFLVETKVPS